MGKSLGFRQILFIILIFFTQPLLAVDYNSVLLEAQKIVDGNLFAGFGFSREILNHSIYNHPLKPRDVDIAILDSKWNSKKASKELSKLGTIQNIKLMKTGLQISANSVKEVIQGFFVHVKIEDIIFDFKFFTSLEMAQERGWTNIEKILIPLNKPLNEITSEIRSLKKQGKENIVEFPSLNIIDKHNGVSDVINKKLKIVNWPGMSIAPIKSAIHIGRLVGKGYNYSPEDFKKLREMINRNPSMNGVDSYYLDRLYSRNQSNKTYDFLNKLGVLSIVKKQRLFEAGDIVHWINRQKPKASPSCKSLL